MYDKIFGSWLWQLETHSWLISGAMSQTTWPDILLYAYYVKTRRSIEEIEQFRSRVQTSAHMPNFRSSRSANKTMFYLNFAVYCKLDVTAVAANSYVHKCAQNCFLWRSYSPTNNLICVRNNTQNSCQKQVKLKISLIEL